MALIKCPECGREVSDTAKQCPHCGYTLKSNIDTAKQVASVAGNAAQKFFFNYGELVLPLIFLVTGMICLFVGYYGGMYYDFHFNEFIGRIVTPFQDFPFWLLLAGTIILPIFTYVLCRSARKKAEAKDSFTISQPKIVKKSGLLMLLIYILGFAILPIIFYSDYTDAKEDQQQFDPSRIVENNSTTTSSNSSTVVGNYTFTDEKFNETFRMKLNADGSAIIETPQIIENGGEPIYCSYSELSYLGFVRVDFSDYKPVIKSWENRMYVTVRYNNLFLDMDGMYVYPTRDHLKSKNPAHRLKLTKTN